MVDRDSSVPQAVILAGGLGTRLASEIGPLPKALAPVDGRPLLDLQLRLAAECGLKDVLLLVHHRAEMIEAFAGRGSAWGLNIQYHREPAPMGTAGAMINALPLLAPTVIVLYGDTVLNVDLARMVEAHRRAAADATLFLHPNDHPADSDIVEIDDQSRIVAFHPCPHPHDALLPNLVNAALYVVERSALPMTTPSGGLLDFGRHLFPEMLRQGRRLLGYCSREYIKDAGTPDRLARVTADIQTGKVARGSLRTPVPAVFLDRDGTINREVDHLRRADQMALLPGAGPAIRRLNRSDYVTVAVTNQPVIARGECDEAGMERIHRTMAALLSQEGAFLDSIRCCPHHPDAGFPGERAELKIQCACRKPATGMADAAIAEMTLDRAGSWMIGDTTTDIEFGRLAGLKTILVDTGHGGRDGRYSALPDFNTPDLPSAVTFILEGWPRIKAVADRIASGLVVGDRVLIGGQARAGKSSLAGALAISLRASGREVVRIGLDGWLRNLEDRPADGDVRSRYDMARLSALAAAITAGDRIEVPVYDRLSRRIRQGPTVAIPADSIVILEGVPALICPDLVALARVRLHVACHGEELWRRFLELYRQRGLTDLEIEALFADRMRDEAPLVEEAAGVATDVVETLRI